MTRRKRTETRWVIVYEHGLYTGQWHTRADAIVAHVSAKGVPDGFDLDGNATGYHAPFGREACLAGWSYWRKQGDRAVKATITWEEPAK